MIWKIFVYGTLRRNQSRNRILSDGEFIGKGTSNGFLYDMGNFPGAVFSSKTDKKIVGEVYAVPNQIKETLDIIEAEGFLYKLVPIKVVLDNGETIDAHAYEYMRGVTNLRLIKSGDFCEQEARS